MRCATAIWRSHYRVAADRSRALEHPDPIHDVANPPEDGVSIELIRSLAGFSGLEDEWERLYAVAQPRNPFLSYAWTRACWESQGFRLEPFLIALRRGPRLVGLAPLALEKLGGWRVLRFIGDSRSDYLGFLSAPDVRSAEQQLMRAAAANRHLWDVALLRQLAVPFTSVHELEAPPHVKLHKAQWTTSAYCSWDGDWDSLERNGPSWIREMRRRRRRFHRDGGTATLFTGEAAIERLGTVARIEAASWKEREGVSRLQPGAGQELLRRAFATMREEAQLWIACVGDEAAAFQVAFVTPERLWLYQASFDERFAKSRAGSVLAHAAIEQAWRGGVREYDYLAGEEPYKLERTSALRPLYHVAAHPKTARGWLAYSTLVAPRWKLRKVSALKRLYDAQRRFLASLRRRSA